MEILLSNMRSHMDAVYDVTVVFGDEDGSCLDKSKPMPGLLCKLSVMALFFTFWAHTLMTRPSREGGHS